MNTKFDKVLHSFIEENITIDQKRIADDIKRVAASLPAATKAAFGATSDAMASATETDPIESEFLKLAKYKDISDEEKTKIIMSLIAKKALPDVTGKMEKNNQQQNSEEESEENQTQSTEKPKQSSFTYSAPSFQ